MSFEALRADLELMQKSLTIAPTPAVAAGTETDPAAVVVEGAPAPGGELMKSFSFELADGTVIDAMDGTELVKALGDRLVATETALAKAQTDTVEVVGMQSALIKSLTAQVAALSGQGAGRRSVLRTTESITPANTTVVEEPMGKSLTFKTGGDAMAAADKAFGAGRITGLELAKCENFVGRGLQFPADLAARVVG